LSVYYNQQLKIVQIKTVKKILNFQKLKNDFQLIDIKYAQTVLMQTFKEEEFFCILFEITF